jgi:hypothetical protein
LQDVGDKKPLLSETARLLRHVDDAAQAQAVRLRAWRSNATGFAIASAIASAIAGASAFSSVVTNKQIAGWVALVAAALAATSAGLGSERRAGTAAASQKAYAVVRDKLRQFACLDLPSLPAKEAREKISALTVDVHAADQAADLPGRSFGWRPSVRRRRKAEPADWWWSAEA